MTTADWSSALLEGVYAARHNFNHNSIEQAVFQPKLHRVTIALKRAKPTDSRDFFPLSDLEFSFFIGNFTISGLGELSQPQDGCFRKDFKNNRETPKDNEGQFERMLFAPGSVQHSQVESY